MSDALSSLPPTGEGLHADPKADDATIIRQDRFDEVLAEYLLLADEGAVDQDAFLERYPEFADDLEAYFDAEEEVEQFNASAAGVGDSERTHVFFANTPKGGHDGSSDLNVLRPVDATATVPRLIDDYEVLQEIAHGGMGRVFLARQTSLNRLVALKMTLSGQFASPHDVRRFRMEAEAAARLGDHPAIVPIYEVGEVDGRQYFTMQFIDGPSLAAKIIAGPIDPQEAARIVLQVAQAIQYAHEYGVLHRDLKPANILIDRNGQPKLTDFGLAKSADSSNALTSSGLIIGTPSYMSPEQASGKPGGWEPATDIYSLGAVLYACLVGKPPFQAAIVMETLRQVAEEEPVPPCEINPGVPKDLETICLKCLRKPPIQRYLTAALLADDLGRFLRHEPISARRISKWERFRLWAKRRRATAASIVASISMLIACTIISTSFALWALREAENATMQKNLVSLERDRADESARQATQRADFLSRQQYASLINAAQEAVGRGNLKAAREILLEECPARWRGWEWRYLVREAFPEEQVLFRDGPPVADFVWLPGSRSIVSVSQDGAMDQWEVRTGKRRQLAAERLDFASRKYFFEGATVSPDGRWMAMADGRCVHVWEIEGGHEAAKLCGHSDGVSCVSISPDGTRLASGGANGRVVLWSIPEGKELHRLAGHRSKVTALAFDAVGGELFSAAADEFKAWSVADGTEIAKLPHSEGIVGNAEYSPTGKDLALSFKEYIFLYDAKTGKNRRSLLTPPPVSGMKFDPDGKVIAAGGSDNAIRLWDVETGNPRATLFGHESTITSLAFSRSGADVAAGAVDGTIRIWDLLKKPSTERAFLERERVAVALDFHPTKPLLTAGYYCTDCTPADSWNTETRKLESGWKPANPTHRLVYSPDGKLIATAAEDNVARIHDAETGERIAVLTGHQNYIRALAFSPDSRRLATGSLDSTIRVWDVAAGRELFRLQGFSADSIMSVAYSPDGSMIAAAARDESIRLWDANSGQGILILRSEGKIKFENNRALHPKCLAFRPDGKMLASGSEGGVITLWDVAAEREAAVLRDHASAIAQVSFSPDGERLLSASVDGSIKLWDVVTGMRLLTIRVARGPLWCGSFGPDGSMIAAGGTAGVALWSAPDEFPPRMRQAIAAYFGARARKAGNPEDAVRYLAEAARFDLRNPQWSAMRGRQYERMSDFDNAVASYNRCIQLDGDASAWRLARALALSHKGDLAAALVDLDRLIAAKPSSGELYRWRGLCNLENGKLAEAIEDFAKASSLEPENASNCERLAEVHLAQGDLPAAADDYRRAIERNPANSGYRTRLGVILERMSKPDEANQEYAAAIRRDPRQCNRAIARSRVLLASGQTAGAFASIESLLKQGVEDARLYLARADVALQANQPESAAADRDRAVRLDPSLTSWRNPFGLTAEVPYSKDHEAVEFGARAFLAGGDEDRNALLWPDPAFRAADSSIEGAWNCRFISSRGVVAEGAALIRSVGSSVFILQYDQFDDECRLFECNRTGDRLSGRFVSLIHDDNDGPWTARILGADRIDGLTRLGRFDLRRQPPP